MHKKTPALFKLKDISPLKLSFIINLILAVLLIVIIGGHFESNDDSGMSGIVEGIYGNKNAHIIFINIIIGKILKILYTIIPVVKWYVVFQYAGLFFSFTFLTYLLLKESLSLKRLLLTLLIVIPFSFECYISLQFTKTAGILCATGIVGLFYALRYRETKLLHFVGAFLVLLGSMFRFQSFLIVCAIMCIMGLFVIIENNKIGKKNLKSFFVNSKTYIVAFAITFFLVFTLNAADKIIYASNGEWAQFLTYNEARYKLLDYGFPSYEEYEEEYKQMGYTAEDIQMYGYWTFADPDKLPVESMKQIYELHRTKKISVKLIISFLQDFPLKLITMPLTPVVLLMIIYYFLFCKNKKYYTLGYLLLAEILSYFFFYYKGRYENTNRLDVVFLYAITCTLMLLVSWSAERHMRRENPILRIMAAVCTIYVFFFLHIFPLEDTINENIYVYQEFYDNIQADTSSIYLENTGSILHMNAYEMWDVFPEGLSQNRYSLGNWLTNSPITNDILRYYGIRNPFRDLIDNPNVYLIDNCNIDMELSYINRNYNEDAKAALVKNVHGFLIYKIYTEVNTSYGMDLIKESKNIVSDVQVDYVPEENIINISGILYKKNVNSFQQEFYVDFYQKDAASHNILPATQFQSDSPDLYNGKYGKILQSFPTEGMTHGDYDIRVILHMDQENYLVAEKNIMIE